MHESPRQHQDSTKCASRTTPRVAMLLAPLLSLLLAPFPAAASQAESFDGRWEGHIEFQGVRLFTVINIKTGETGIGGTVDSPDQNAFGLPITGGRIIDKDSIELTMSTVGAIYTATLDGDERLTGTWQQNGVELPLALSRKKAAPSLPARIAAGLPGTWEGTLDAMGTRLRLVFHVKRGEDGSLQATLDSPDQGALGMPVAGITGDGDSVRFALDRPRAAFAGKLDRSGESITGNWEQGGAKLPLIMRKVIKATTMPRPQTPKPPYPYLEEEVAYRNDIDGVLLAGTLTLPQSDGPFAAALLITGSGAQDRDETIYEHRPFRVIADHLTRRGIAVLRVDDRGVGGSEAGPRGATSADFANDVEAGVRFLAQHPRIRKNAIGLIGHSEGGLIAPMVAARTSDVAFLVLLAGPGTTGEQILYQQSELIMRAGGATEAQARANRKTQEALFRLALDPSLTAEQVRKRGRAALEADPAFPDGADGEAAINAQLAQVSDPWMRFFLAYDPVPALEKIRVPVLALNGELDLQVPCETNLAAIGKALEAAGNTRFQLVARPGQNHLFQNCKTGSPSEYARIEETFCPETLELIGNWIAATTKAMR